MLEALDGEKSAEDFVPAAVGRAALRLKLRLRNAGEGKDKQHVLGRTGGGGGGHSILLLLLVLSTPSPTEPRDNKKLGNARTLNPLVITSFKCFVLAYRRDDKVRPMILLASDAMKTNGAFLWLSPQGAELDFGTHKFESTLSINFKETDMGRRALLWAIRRFPVCDIRLAVDNTTAFVGLTRLIFISDDDLQNAIDEMSAEAKAADCTLAIVQVAGLVMAADERSRGRISDPQKGKICADFLLQARTLSWFVQLRKRQRGAVERQR